MRHSIVRPALFATSLVLALGLVGCGQSENTTDTAASDDTVAQNTATEDTASGQTSDEGQSADVQMLDEAGLRKQIIDHTVTGSMSTGGDYGEYYAPDGNVLAADYTGTWTIEDDKLCIDYGDGADCYGAAMDGLDVVWYLDGDKVGTGSLQQGNVNDYSADASGE